MTALDPTSQISFERRSRTALVRPSFDILVIGGLSLFIFGVMFLLVPKDVDINHLSWTMFYLGFVVNGPHFFASYWHLYVDNRQRLREWRFAFAGFVVPAVLVTSLFAASRKPTVHTLGLLVGLMYLSVGWHYVKQIFGVSLVSSAAHGRPVTGIAKKLFRVNLLIVWLMSWTFANQHSWDSDKSGFFGATYSSANLDQIFKDNGLTYVANHFRVIVYLLVGVSLTLALGAFLRQWIRTGSTMAPVGWVAWASIYVWYLPVLAHPAYFYLVPFFHSIQYLLFSVTFSWNKARSESAIDDPIAPITPVLGVESSDLGESVLVEPLAKVAVDPLEISRLRRQKFALRFGLFVVFAFLLGAAGFHWLPEWMDRNYNYRGKALGGQFWVVAFNVFINVHHYFVDSVIWRGTNPQVRKFLKPKTLRA
jgi:hypothetical protein